MNRDAASVPTDAAPRRHTIGLLLLGAAAFAAAYGQAPLYYSNQNQYFVHGLAAAGVGELRQDWLANTADPTPVFSALVALTAGALHPAAFYLYHAALLAAYAVALVGLFAVLAGPERAARRWPVFLALLVLVHAALARWLSYRVLGQDYPWYLQAGVAGQYLLGAMLQPSVFGVLLLVGVVLFARGRDVAAVVCAALGATIHSTYLLPAGLLTAGFLTARLVERRPRAAVGLGALALALVLPVTLYVLVRFGPTAPATFAEAQDILVNLRIPHHARVDLWLDPVAAVQLGWMGLGIALLWRTRLFPVLATAAALATVLTLAQVATGSTTLALLFPWRLSAVLMPIATAAILARLVARARLPLDGRAAQVGAAAVAALFAVAGLGISGFGLAFRSGDEEGPLYDFVRRERQAGEVYLLPVRVPDLAKTTRGSLSSDFKPPAAKRQDARIIPPDLQRFRLATGTPIFVDFKSIPYRDADVVEWRDRLLLARDWSAQLRDGRRAAALAAMRRHGITHLVVPADLPLAGPGLTRLPFADAVYQVYRLDAAP